MSYVRTKRLIRAVTSATVTGLLFVGTVSANDAPTNKADPSEAPPDFTETYLADDANTAAGEQIWAKQCRHCHGSSAYPGKAPKLKPRRYKPEFVFKRVTNGFRKMPPWGHVYSREERMSIVAYILSDKFSP